MFVWPKGDAFWGVPKGLDVVVFPNAEGVPNTDVLLFAGAKADGAGGVLPNALLLTSPPPKADGGVAKAGLPKTELPAVAGEPNALFPDPAKAANPPVLPVLVFGEFENALKPVAGVVDPNALTGFPKAD